MRLLLLGITLLVLLTGSVRAAIRANEIMVNEPGSQTNLEWFELHNDAPTVSAQLGFYEITINGTAVAMPPAETIPGNGYLVVCKNRIAFLQEYGDAYAEGANPPPATVRLIELPGAFTVANSAGVLKVRLVAGSAVDSLVWSSSGNDNVSWERTTYNAAAGRQSRDFSGATPGFVNSLTPVPLDLAVDTVAVEKYPGGSLVRVVVVNRGAQTIDTGRIALFNFNPADTSDISDTLATAFVPDLDTGFATVLDIELPIMGLYDTIGVIAEIDDRIRNNRKVFTVVGEQFPPFILSEFLANPSGNYTAEWVELKTKLTGGYDLQGWQLGDNLSLYTITDNAYPLMPESYVAITQSVLDFTGDYPQFTGDLIGPSQWAGLNNDGDVVRLVDPFGIEADRFVYNSVFNNSIPWARSEDPSRPDDWGRAIYPGGTPGDSNEVRFTGSTSGLQLTIEPRIISPDADGVNDEAVISVNGPDDASYTIEVYDRDGRRVKRFEDGAQFLKASYRWNGTADGGRRLPIGIYIVYVEADGLESLKETVVISR